MVRLRSCSLCREAVRQEGHSAQSAETVPVELLAPLCIVCPRSQHVTCAVGPGKTLRRSLHWRSVMPEICGRVHSCVRRESFTEERSLFKVLANRLCCMLLTAALTFFCERFFGAENFEDRNFEPREDFMAQPILPPLAGCLCKRENATKRSASMSMPML